MQAPGRWPDNFGEARLDIHMNIFQRPRKSERARLDLARDLVQTSGDCYCVLRADDPAGRKHRHMRLRAADVLRRKAVVETNGGVYLLHDRIGAAGEASAPHLVAHLPPFPLGTP